MIIWIDIPAAVTLVIIIKLTLMIAKKRRQIREEQNQIASVSARVEMMNAVASIAKANISGSGTDRVDLEKMREVCSEAQKTEEGAPNENVASMKLPSEGASGETVAKIEGNNERMNAERRHEDDVPKPTIETEHKKTTKTPSNTVATIATAVKLIGCISLSYWLTYIPCLVALHKMVDSVSIADVEFGKHPMWHYLMRYFFFFGLPASCVINPVFHFYFNKPLKQALLSKLGIIKATTEHESVTSEVCTK